MNKKEIQPWHKKHPIISTLISTVFFTLFIVSVLFFVTIPEKEDRGNMIGVIIISSLGYFFLSSI